MSSFYHFWRIWLRINKTRENHNSDCSPELLSQCIVKNNRDIAERLSKEGVEVSFSTLTYIIDQYDRIVRDMVCEGYSVKTNNVMFTPELSGKWSMESLVFDPQKHKCSLLCAPSKEMQNAISSIGVKILGFKDTSSFISRVLDVTSGEVNSIISRGGDLVIEGKGIMAVAMDGSSTGCLFLVKENNGSMIDISNRILINTPNQINVKVPSNLEVGKYRLLIYTYYFLGDENPGKYCQCIELENTLHIK